MSQNQQLFLLANIVSVNTTANTLTFTSNSNISTSFNVGGYGNTTTGGFVANSSVLAVGNSSVNVVVNSSAVYVGGAPLGGAINTAAQFTFTNTHIYTANVSVNGAIIANGGAGTSGQVLTSSAGGNVYWSTAAGGFSNGASISVANLAITGSLTANGSVGTSGQALVSTGTGVQWGALSPGYNYSSQFNGSSYLTNLSNSTTLQMGSGDFTVEFWMYSPSIAAQVIFDGRPAGAGQSSNGALQISLQANGSITVYGILNAQNNLVTSSAGTIVANQWYHIALVRSGSSTGNVKLYINGVLASTYGSADTTNYNQGYVNIGCRFDGAVIYAGFISNWRMVKGTAVYTSAFTPPTSPLSAISGTSLLVCNAITPTSDSSTNVFALTNTGPVTTTATLSPFTSTTVSIPTASLTAVRQQFTGDGSTTTFAVAGGYTANAISVFVNGVLLRNGTDVTVTNGSTVVFAIAPLSGALIDVIGTVPTTYSSITPVSYSTQFTTASSQYLSIPANAAFQMTADFTIEFFAYITSFASNPVILDQYVAGTTGAGNWQIGFITSGVLQLYYDGSSYVNSSTLSLNTWYHIAAVRIGSSIKIYINGVLATTQTFAGTLGRSDTTLWIGAQHASGPVNYTSAYISNVRVVKGLAVYTSNFTVPSSPLAITQSASGAYIQAITGTQTSLLTCNGPTIIDGSTNAFTITNNGSAPVSTSIVPTFTNVTINNNNIINFADGTSVGTAQSLSQRNKFINGAMAIDQRNGGASQTITAAAALAYTVDRWYAYCTGANVTGQRVAGSTASSQYNYQFTGAASVTAIGFGQRIEALNCYDLAGTTATLSVLLSNSLLTTVTWTAYYASTADTFGTLASPTRTQIATGTFTINSTLTKYSTNIAIPAAATTGIEVVFSVGAQTSGTWVIGTAQLETGAVATPFERRLYGTELNLCQRYFENSNGDGTAAAASTSTYIFTTTATTNYPSWPFRVGKRTSPTMTVLPNGGTGGAVSPSVGSFFQSSNHGNAAGFGWTANAEL